MFMPADDSVYTHLRVLKTQRRTWITALVY